jgi:zinc transport system substrate-binding protein
MARQLVELGWYIGFTGVLTFKNARKAVEVAASIPLERIVLETDCPYMAPEPFRGKRNDPGKLYRMAEKLAEIRGLSVEEIHAITVENGKRRFIAVADRFPLLYFARRYELDYASAFPGCSSKTEPSPSTVAALTDKVKSEGVSVIFKIELSDGKVASAVAEQTGAEILTFYTLHNVSKEDFENGEGYISLMEKNLQSLKKALN